MLLDSETIAQAREEERSVRDAYDRVPYPSSSQHRTHPDHLAALAILHGLEPAPPDRCRVLELGCADGGNLVPMAIEMPESRFVGIDLSPRQIEAGRAFVAEMGLPNLELQARSLLDVDAGLGEFDYIVCHGVFSWVSRPVQEKILAICRENLAPNGVAYVSYNTLPGWHLRGMVRDMVLFHTRGIDDPEERTGRAFELMRFLAESAGEEQDAHAVFLRTARDHFEEHKDRPSYLIHEYLEETNDPIYFNEMAERAGRHGLQYLTEADPHLTEIGNLPAGVAEGLQRLASDRIALEQYLDFVLNRTFRRTLFCHAGIPVERTAAPERLRRLHAASSAKPVSSEPDLRPGRSESFLGEEGKTFSSSHPLAKAALVALAAAWPRAVPFGGLLTSLGDGADEEGLADLLGSLFWSGVVDLHALPPLCTETVSVLPRTSSLARRQARAGLLVTSQRRRVLKLDDPMARFILLHLDGGRDRAALVRLLEWEVAEGRLDLVVDGKPVEPGRVPVVLEALLEQHLRKMAEHALLVG
ncbi:MAG TPA: methyltransferase regulatory domain-containing protein [Thermoanaerobaculia bacterium]|nr:methyltransferase regulatory domain-containing protein [Thermoanaerobaculia bacterium]